MMKKLGKFLFCMAVITAAAAGVYYAWKKLFGDDGGFDEFDDDLDLDDDLPEDKPIQEDERGYVTLNVNEEDVV